jgi:hypothetical protein
MTNLADLLPAGGGQNNTDFVADGNVSAGAPVILTAAGKAAAIAESSVTEAAGSATTFASVTVNGLAAAYDPTNDKVVVFYSDADDAFGKGKVVIGTVSGTSISFGSPVTVTGNRAADQSVVFDPDSGNVVLFYQDTDNSYYGTAIVGTVSGTSISFGSAVVFSSSSNNYNSAVYDTSTDRVYNSYTDAGNSNYGTAVVGTVSGTSISLGTPVVFNAAATYPTSSAFDSNANKVVTAYYNAGDGYSKGIVGTVSGTSVSFGSPTTFHTGTGGFSFASVYDVNANKTLISFKDVNNSNYGSSIVGTVSGTSISFGTAAAFEDATTDQIKGCYDSNTNKVVIVYRDGGSSYYGTAVNATISGTSVTFTTPFQLIAGSTNPQQPVFDPDSNKVAFSFANTTVGAGQGLIYTPPGTSTNLTSTNLLGLAPSAISDTATGTINTWGSRCENNDFFGTVSVSLGTADTTSGNTTKENLSMAYDSNANRTILVYRDGNDSDKLKCIIGTLSGTSTSWGTAVEIVGNTAGNNGTAVVYDSNAQRVLIAYTDANNSNYPYVVVGEISGTSITLGTPVAVASHGGSYPELSYDTADQKVLIVYANTADSYYPYSAACTITAVGNSVAVTTPASVSSRAAGYPFGLAYNANDAKHVLDIANSTGYAYVLTMSSGSISVGTEASYSPGFTARNSLCVYDSSAQKIVRGYNSTSDPRPVEFAVASISGTDVTFGTAVTCFAGNGNIQTQGTFDSNKNQLAFFNLTFATTSLETNFGTVSGTTITFGTATTVASSGVYSASTFDVAYDSTAQKLIYAYRATTFDAAVGTLSATPLTVTTDYYVQEDGTISTTSTSPAQLIGKAIKTNQINIKDYTG